MVRVNPLHEGTDDEVAQVIAQGADLLMLPMFQSPADLSVFSAIVGGRLPIVPLLETAGALATLDQWIDTPGLYEVFVGLNDLHLSLGCRFMFEPLADGLLEPVARATATRGLRLGFGGIARLDEGLLPGRDVLAEHLRLGSRSVILSRTFHQGSDPDAFEAEVESMRRTETELTQRSAAQVEADRLRIAAVIRDIAAGLPARAAVGA